MATGQSATLAAVYTRCHGLPAGVVACPYLLLATSVRGGSLVTLALP